MNITGRTKTMGGGVGVGGMDGFHTKSQVAFTESLMFIN